MTEEFTPEERAKIYEEKVASHPEMRKRTPKPKYKSRATRAAELASNWRSAEERLRELRDDAEGEDFEKLDTLLKEAFVKDIIRDAKEVVENIDTSELDALAEEMRAWADNYPENLQGTDKYSTIEEAASTLENISSDDVQGAEITELEDITQVADDLERMIDDLEGVEFPGMFG